MVLKVPNKSRRLKPKEEFFCPRLCQQISWSNNVPASVISGSLNHQGTKDRITTQFCNRVNTEYKFLCTDFLAQRKPYRAMASILLGGQLKWSSTFLKSHFLLLLLFCCWRHCKDLKGFNENVKMRHCVIAIQLWSVQVADHWLVKTIDWFNKQSTKTYLFVTPLMIQKKGERTKKTTSKGVNRVIWNTLLLFNRLE